MKKRKTTGLIALESQGPSERIAYTRSGVPFAWQAMVWHFRDGLHQIHVDFGALPACVNALVNSEREALRWFMANKSPTTAKNFHDRFLDFARFLEATEPAYVKELKPEHFLNYRTAIGRGHEHLLTSLRTFLKRWFDMRLPGVSAELNMLMKQLRISGGVRGRAVRQMDPLTGPLTHLEDEAFQSALNQAHAEGQLSRQDYLLIWLFRAIGYRPIQCAALKVRDLRIETLPGGVVQFCLMVPRAKQRGTIDIRREMKKRPLVSQLGRPLMDYANDVRDRYFALGEDGDDAPLFPPTKHKPATGLEKHMTDSAMSHLAGAALEKVHAVSERTGQPMHLFATRLRRTMATRASQEGYGALVIAELLDHSDTNNVAVYVEASSEISQRIDRATAHALAPLANAFLGRLIEDETKSTRKGDPTSRILDLRIDQSGQCMGSCAQCSACSLKAPLACYTCPRFEPWLDGPHEKVLDHLLEERERIEAKDGARMCSINDRTILAVCKVIQLCREHGKESP